jgi:outer membrane immunogenic protein
MNRILIASALLAGTISVASAADVYTPDSLKDTFTEDRVEGTAVNWSGVYFGGAIGYGNSNHELSVSDYFKDYCDHVRYKQAGIEDSSDNKFLDLSRGLNFSLDDLENCDAPDPAPTNGALLPLGIEPGDSREVATLNGLNSSGIIGDVRAGADFAQGRFLFGVFGTYGFSQMEADGSGFGAFESFTLDKGDEWSIGGRLGYLVSPSTLLYALAAYTQTDYEFAGVFDGDPFSKDTTFDGVTVGGGIEFAVSSNVFLGIEGTHTFYGEETIFDNYNADKNVGTSIVDDLDETKVMGTLKIKLNSF